MSYPAIIPKSAPLLNVPKCSSLMCSRSARPDLLGLQLFYLGYANSVPTGPWDHTWPLTPYDFFLRDPSDEAEQALLLSYDSVPWNPWNMGFDWMWYSHEDPSSFSAPFNTFCSPVINSSGTAWSMAGLASMWEGGPSDWTSMGWTVPASWWVYNPVYRSYSTQHAWQNTIWIQRAKYRVGRCLPGWEGIADLWARWHDGSVWHDGWYSDATYPKAMGAPYTQLIFPTNFRYLRSFTTTKFTAGYNSTDKDHDWNDIPLPSPDDDEFYLNWPAEAMTGFLGRMKFHVWEPVEDFKTRTGYIVT